MIVLKDPDRTVKDLLALPTSQSAIVLAKFVVVAVWSIALAVMICLVGLCVGATVGLSQASTQVVLQGGVTTALVACLTIALVIPMAFFASAGHGYLPPMSFVFLVLLPAQVIAAASWGGYFPWSIPALYSQSGYLESASLVNVILTGVAGIAGALIWWVLADQTR